MWTGTLTPGLHRCHPIEADRSSCLARPWGPLLHTHIEASPNLCVTGAVGLPILFWAYFVKHWIEELILQQDMREVLRDVEQLQQATAAAGPAPHRGAQAAVEEPDQLLGLPAYFQVVEVPHMPLILAPQATEGRPTVLIFIRLRYD